MKNNRFALEMQEVKDLLKDEVELYSQHLMYICMHTCIHVHLSILTNLSSKTLGESGRGGSFACFWE